MRPFPCEATDESWPMAEKSLVNDVAETAAAAVVAVVDPVVVAVDDFFELLPQATSPAASTRATDKTLVRLTVKFILPPFCHPVSEGARSPKPRRC